jgi:hypothetical protein
MGMITVPFFVRIKDGEYELNEDRELVFVQFLDKPVEERLVLGFSGHQTLKDGTKIKVINIATPCNDLSTVRFNEVRASIRTDEHTGRQYCVFNGKQRFPVFESEEE